VKALEIELTPEQIAALDAVSKPALNFPAWFNTKPVAKFRPCWRNRVLIATLPVSLFISLRAGLLVDCWFWKLNAI
jgi:hypothetical protein